MTNDGLTIRSVETNGVQLNVATAGKGPAVLLLHGWPHTWRLWSEVIPWLANRHFVIAPDLRGLGGSSRPVGGFDAATGAEDVAGLLDTLGVETAAVAAIDASVPAAFLLAMRAVTPVTRLVLMESLLPGLPGAEAFLAAGSPWWFGFHAVPGLAEQVLSGREGDYIDWFLTAHSYGHRGVSVEVRDAFVAAYTGRDALQAGFEYYRTNEVNAEQIARSVVGRRLVTPTMALGGNVVGDALHHQLAGVSSHLEGHLVPECGHLIPLEQPERCANLLLAFLAH